MVNYVLHIVGHLSHGQVLVKGIDLDLIQGPIGKFIVSFVI